MYVLFPIAVCLFFFVLTQKRTKKVKKFVRKFGSKLPTVDAAYRCMLFFSLCEKRISACVTTISEQTSFRASPDYFKAETRTFGLRRNK